MTVVASKMHKARLSRKVNPCKYGYVSKLQTLLPANINKFTAHVEQLTAALTEINMLYCGL